MPKKHELEKRKRILLKPGLNSADELQPFDVDDDALEGAPDSTLARSASGMMQRRSRFVFRCVRRCCIWNIRLACVALCITVAITVWMHVGVEIAILFPNATEKGVSVFSSENTEWSSAL